MTGYYRINYLYLARDKTVNGYQFNHGGLSIYFYENKEWELYDLQKDPNELNNVYNGNAYQKIQDSLKNELQIQIRKFKETRCIASLPKNILIWE